MRLVLCDLVIAIVQEVNMSDHEDDMDVDGPASEDPVLFGSNSTASKGKRIVADLPVEAEDNLPWQVSAHFHSTTADCQTGWRNTVLTPSMMCQVIKIFLPPSTDSLSITCYNPCLWMDLELILKSAITSPPIIRSTRNWQDIYDSCSCSKDLWCEEHAANGPGIECF